VRSDREQVVLAARRAREPRGAVLVFGDEPPVLTQLDVRAGLIAPVVARRAVGVEADQPGEPAGAAVDLVDDLFVVDAFQELASQTHAGRLAALPQLVEKAVRDQLQSLFDQLVVDLALLLDLVGSLEPGREPGFELTKADVVEAGGVDVISGDAAVGLAAQLDGPVDGPVRRTRVVDRDEDLAVHQHLPLWAGRVCERRDRLSSKRGYELPTL